MTGFVGILLLLGLLAPLAAGPAAAQGEEPTLVDRVVGVVDEDPILWSDIVRVISLGLVAPVEGEEAADHQRRVFDGLVDTRLRFHEVDRFGIQNLPLSEVEAQYREIQSSFPSQTVFEARLSDLGLGPNQLREILARQLMVLRFVEERLGPRVFVPLDEIQQYYDETLAPEMRRQGQPVPDIGEVREQIRAVLREERLNQEIDLWTAELRLRADIIDSLEREPRELPPVVEP